MRETRILYVFWIWHRQSRPSPPEQEVVPGQHAATHHLVECPAAGVGEHGLSGGVLGRPEAELDAVVAGHVAGHLDGVQQGVDGDRVLRVRQAHLGGGGVVSGGGAVSGGAGDGTVRVG